jgi:flavin-dependent dehydrogenase
MAGFDYDVLIIGSGFGGSAAALRAAEKGYRVGVMDQASRMLGAVRYPYMPTDVDRYIKEKTMPGLPTGDHLYAFDDLCTCAGHAAGAWGW